MFEMQSKNGVVKVYAKTIEQEAISQICAMANSPIGENAHIRIMPDAHAGAGCTIGTTMVVTDKVCPNVVGVDLGCGVNFVRTDTEFDNRLEELDKIIHQKIPSGRNVHSPNNIGEDFFKEMYCWEYLKKDVKETAMKSLGTLGGGNHFIEAYSNGGISVHSGSRNIGLNVAKYYQKIAEKDFELERKAVFEKMLKEIPPKERQSFILANKVENLPNDLRYLTGEHMEMYLHDSYIMTEFAEMNREKILSEICSAMGCNITESIVSTHNYIGKEDRILRKGAISASKGKRLVIPLNMRDGILICTGKGNEDWNCSAPHGAGRLYSRSKAKEIFSVDEFAKSMDGIYTTCVNESTIDEAPFVYKNYMEIMEAIKDTVDIEERLKPIYNFKASE